MNNLKYAAFLSAFALFACTTAPTLTADDVGTAANVGSQPSTENIARGGGGGGGHGGGGHGGGGGHWGGGGHGDWGGHHGDNDRHGWDNNNYWYGGWGGAGLYAPFYYGDGYNYANPYYSTPYYDTTPNYYYNNDGYNYYDTTPNSSNGTYYYYSK